MQFIYLLLALALSSPTIYEYTSVNREVYDVQSLDVDSNIYYTILPYKTELDAQMNAVICHSTVEMSKKKPESLLGNWTSDVCLEMAQYKYEDDIDLSFFNTGGLRSPIPQGDITKRDLYKLMPFENELVVLKLNKTEMLELKAYYNLTDGQPVAFADNFTLNDSLFLVLTTDYLANGGDKMKFFKDKIQHKVGIKMRDALINYCIKKDTISSNLDKRYMILLDEK
tara:strand:- start:1827 stop:2504 length:678 start_codon:yes stop_codon:yes gene_type:complete